MYNTLKIYGEQQVNYLMLDNHPVEDIILQEMLKSPEKAEWQRYTMLLATYINSINAGNITQGGSPITGWQLYKQRIDSKGEHTLEFVAQTGREQVQVYDYNVANHKQYRYILFMYTDVEIAERLESQVITPDANVYSLTDVIPTEDKQAYLVGETWVFEHNLQSDAMTQNLNRVVTTSVSGLPKVSKINRVSYLSGGLACLLGKVSNSDWLYADNIEMLEAWNAFCANGHQKLYKDPKGVAMLVDIIETSTQYLDSAMGATNLTFSYVQTGDVSNLAIGGVPDVIE